MFTGLVETLGAVRARQPENEGCRLRVACPLVSQGLALGASVAVNGVCLSVVSIAGEEFEFQVGPESLRLTNLGALAVGSQVNLERPLRIGDRLGGHIVQGHVDGVGVLQSRQAEGDFEIVWFQCPPALARQMIKKGSIAVDGISLTLVDVAAAGFSVALIPHTLQVTTLGGKRPGDTVNLETDLFAKYAHKYMEHYGAKAGP